MASLYKKTGSPYYWMRFSHNGKRYQESTKKKREDHAAKIMESRIEAVKGFGSHSDLFSHLLEALEKLPKRDQEKAVKEYAQRLRDIKGRKMLIADAFPHYLSTPKKRTQSAVTIKHHTATWKLFTNWLAEKRPDCKWLHDIDDLTAEDYLKHAWERGVTERTYNTYRQLLMAVFRTCRKTAGLDSNPFEEIEKLNDINISKRPLSAEQLQDAVSRASGDLRLLLLVGTYTGLRLGDASLLKWDEVNLKTGVITVTPRKTRSSTGKELHIPISPPLAIALHNQEQSGEYVMPDIATAYQKHANYVSTQVQQVFLDMGLRTNTAREDGRGKRLSCLYGFHSFRHSFVSLCHNSNLPQVTVMELVGHTSPEVHRIYTHSDQAVLKAGIAKLPDITGAE